MGSDYGVKNPLAIVHAIAALEKNIAVLDLSVCVDSDMAAFAAAKMQCRGFAPAPMHDHTVCDFTNERGFWMALKNSSGAIVGLQAYRCDNVDISLAEWCSNYMIGVYMRRGEMLVPQHPHAPKNSIAHKLRGKLVYHGEVWIDKTVKGREVVSDFSVLGALLALLKWNYDALWALTSQSIASRGYPGRMGYPIIERGFLRWQWHSEGIEPIEYLTVAEKHHIENMVDEPVTSLALPFSLCAPKKSNLDDLKTN